MRRHIGKRLGWTSRTKAKLVGAVAALLIAVAESKAQSKAPAAPPQKPETKTVERRIVVSIPDRKLAVIEDGTAVKIYRVAVGAKDSASPAGEFRIINRISQPAYYAPGVVIPARQDKPLGPPWICPGLRHFGSHGPKH